MERISTCKFLAIASATILGASVLQGERALVANNETANADAIAYIQETAGNPHANETQAYADGLETVRDADLIEGALFLISAAATGLLAVTHRPLELAPPADTPTPV